jgi:hypothetical protein
MCPHRPATWAGSRAGSPVSECVSPMERDTQDIVLCACTTEIKNCWKNLILIQQNVMKYMAQREKKKIVKHT